MSLYADRYAIDAVACRIGSFLPEPETTRNLSTWLSHDDCVRMVEAALTTTAPGFAVLYGISANTRAWWDLEPGRRLGYEPQDDAEAFADRIPRVPRTRPRRRTSVGPSRSTSSSDRSRTPVATQLLGGTRHAWNLLELPPHGVTVSAEVPGSRVGCT